MIRWQPFFVNGFFAGMGWYEPGRTRVRLRELPNKAAESSPVITDASYPQGSAVSWLVQSQEPLALSWQRILDRMHQDARWEVVSDMIKVLEKHHENTRMPQPGG